MWFRVIVRGDTQVVAQDSMYAAVRDCMCVLLLGLGPDRVVAGGSDGVSDTEGPIFRILVRGGDAVRSRALADLLCDGILQRLRARPWFVTVRRGVCRGFVLCCVMLFYVLLCDVIHAISGALLSSSVLFRFASLRFALLCFALFCFLLFCSVLFCSVLFCSVLPMLGPATPCYASWSWSGSVHAPRRKSHVLTSVHNYLYDSLYPCHHTT